MSFYENTLVTKQDLPESQLKIIKEKYSDLINSNSGKVIKIEEWGLLNLSRKIKRYNKAFYIHYKFEGSKSVRFVVQHLWAEKDRKNWAAAVLEYNFNSRFALYVADNWNYGDTDIHYYSVGGSYSKGRTRLGVNYGRQRGGLICIGGVCRFVPENTGVTANLTVSF